MDIMELGAIGELVGGVAVIASLIYVGVQLRQNTKATEVASHQAITEMFNTINLTFGSRTDVSRVFRLGLENSPEITDDERIQFGFLCLATFRAFEMEFYQSQAGAFQGTQWDDSIRYILSSAGGGEWWRTNPYPLPLDFRLHVESLVPALSAAAEALP